MRLHYTFESSEMIAKVSFLKSSNVESDISKIQCVGITGGGGAPLSIG